MHAAAIYRTAALALVVGAAMAIVGLVLSRPIDEIVQGVAGPEWQWGARLILAGNVLAVPALAAIYARQSAVAGVLGLIGFVGLVLTLMLFGVILGGINLLVLPWVLTLGISGAQMEQGPPGLQVLFLGGTAAVLIGTILFAVATLRARVFSAWPAWLLLVSGVLSLLPFVLPDEAPALLFSASPIVGYVALLLYGLNLWVVAEMPAQRALPAIEERAA